MQPSNSNQSRQFLSSFFNTMAEDKGPVVQPENIRKVFCSQSVVLMLRYALDAEGEHSGLLQTLTQLNSRLVSPKQIHSILETFGASPLSNQELALLAQIP